MALSIDFSIEITIDYHCEKVFVEVDNSADAEYGIEVEYEVEVVQEEPKVEISYEINTSGWEQWGADVNVPAKGWFDQGGEKFSVDFWDFRLAANGDLRGCGQDVNGVFDIVGKLNASSYFKFDKTYRGAHTVVYTGKRQGSNLAGKWEIPGNCEGVFKMQTGWQKWGGGFWQGDFNAMELDNMYVGSDGVRGGGGDAVGTFDVKGWRTGSTVCFAKQYHGQHTVYYQGSLNGRVLSGRWEIPGNCEGRFQLTCSRNVGAKTDNILTGFSMVAGERLTSPNGEYFFVLQDDGNLCLYRGNQCLFATMTNGKMQGPKSGWRLILQTDGHTVLYDGENTCRWSTGIYGDRARAGDQNQKLVMQDDGNLVQYTSNMHPVWCTRTEGGMQSKGVDFCGN